MTRDVTKLQFFSDDPADKIVATGTVTVTNDGNTTAASGTGDGPQKAKIAETSITNSYGKKSFVRYVWAVDGTNFNSSLTHLLYDFTLTYTDIPVTSDPLQGLKGAVSVGLSDSLIYFRTANGFHGNVSTTSGNPNNGYTPTSQTFTIKYAVYEKE